MVRYKRKRGYYRKSTNTIMMKFQSFMDIQTSDSSMQVISISAGGKEIVKRLSAQFGAYKYYKIGNIAVKLVPATTLPVDPSGLSINAGGTGVNPVDQLSPGMMRITNGEDILEDMTGLTTTEQDAIYNNMLLDPRWFKWMLQTGVKRHATPRYWQIGQLHQDKWPGAITNLPAMRNVDGTWIMDGTNHLNEFVNDGSTPPAIGQPIIAGSSPYGFFQTGHSGVLGWLPTDGLVTIGDGLQRPLLASPPEVEVFKIILPRARLTKYPYRLYVTETVYFREPIVNFGVPYNDPLSGTMYFRPLDVFHTPPVYVPRMPDEGYTPADNFPNDSDTGGNYGSD